MANGATVLDPQVVATMLRSTGRAHPVETLTAREREALELMGGVARSIRE